ncbi:MAG: hypothetical protein ACE5MM_03060 [Nitrospiraceae bacterium]
MIRFKYSSTATFTVTLATTSMNWSVYGEREESPIADQLSGQAGNRYLTPITGCTVSETKQRGTGS